MTMGLLLLALLVGFTVVATAGHLPFFPIGVCKYNIYQLFIKIFTKYPLIYEKQGRIIFFFKIEYLKAFFFTYKSTCMISQNEHNFSITEKNVFKVCVLCFDVCDLFLKIKPYQSIVANVFIFSYCITHCNKCKILIAFLFIFYFKTRCCVMYFFSSCCSLDIILIFTLSQIILYIYSINQINVYL